MEVERSDSEHHLRAEIEGLKREREERERGDTIEAQRTVRELQEKVLQLEKALREAEKTSRVKQTFEVCALVLILYIIYYSKIQRIVFYMHCYSSLHTFHHVCFIRFIHQCLCIVLYY